MIFKIYSRLVCACVCRQEYITTSLKFPTKAGFKVIKCAFQSTSLCGRRTLSTKGAKESPLLRTQGLIISLGRFYYHSHSDTYDMVPLTSNSPCRASALRPTLFTALLSCSVCIYLCQHTSLPQSHLFLSSPNMFSTSKPSMKKYKLASRCRSIQVYHVLSLMSLTLASFPEK